MVIVITGASRGMGKAIAEAFAQDKQGHTFLLCARTEDRLLAFAKDLQGRFPRTQVLSKAADLTVKAEVVEWAAWALEQTGTIDILINNAGTFIPGSVHSEEDGILEQMLSLNLFAAYHLTRRLLPKMLAQQTGHIFNICSIASTKAYSNGGAYSISKFALYGFSKNLREELKDKGINVTTVLPGAVMTDSWEGFDNSNGRIMEATDIAKLVYAAAHLSPQACVEEIVVRPKLGDL